MPANPAWPLTPQELLEVAQIESVSGSADGQQVAFMTTRQDLTCDCHQQTWQVLNVKSGGIQVIDGSTEAALMYLGDGRVTSGYVFSSSLWSPDSTQLLYIKTVDGRNRIALYDVATKTSALVGTDGGDVYSAAWGDSSEEILYLIAEVSDAAKRQWETGKTEGYLYDYRFMPGYQHAPLYPQHLGPMPYDGGGAAPLQIIGKAVDLRTGVSRDVAADEIDRYANVSVMLWGERETQAISSPDGSVTATIEEGKPASGRKAGLLIRRNGAAVSCGQSCSGKVTHLFWHRHSNSLIYAVEPADRSQPLQFYSYSKRTGRIGVIAQVPRRWGSTHNQCAGAVGELICFRETALEPPKLIAIDLKSGKVRDLFDPNAAAREKIEATAEVFSMQDKHGGSFSGRMIYPKEYTRGRRYPLVVTGYIAEGFARGGSGDEYPIIPFAESGMAVLDYSWSNTSSAAPKYSERGGHFKLLSIISESIQEKIDRLVAAGVVDSARVAITGLSGSSDYVNYELINGRPKAVAITSGGTFDPIQYFIVGPRMQSLYFKTQGYPNPSWSEDVSMWRRMSLAMNARTIHTPLLINAADSEYLNNIETWAAFKDAGVPIEMHVYGNEYHIKISPLHRLSIYRRNIDWLRFWLQNYEDPDVAKQEQYSRWRLMRSPARP